MKLYATTTSERASKGQGGNEFIEIEILNEKKETCAKILVEHGEKGRLKIRVDYDRYRTEKVEKIPWEWGNNIKGYAQAMKENHYGQHIENGLAYCADCKKFEDEYQENVCQKCGEIHDVEKAGGHDLIQASKVLLCECREFPDDEFCQQVLKNEEEAQKGKQQKGD